VNFIERALHRRRPGCSLLVLPALLLPALAIADTPIASSNFAGVESPLSENGAWQALPSLAPDGVRFQKNNGAFTDRFDGTHHNHATARTTALVPADHYSEIVVGHIGNGSSYVGPAVRIQVAGPSVDSHYLWWGSLANGQANFLYRIVANGTTYTPATILPHSPFADGDRLRLIARGPVIYGIKNGVREFIYNTGTDSIRYATGTSGMLAFVPGAPLTDATIASWSTGAAPSSSGTWASSNFAGVEDPLDEGDRWFPLPGYSGFRKAGGLAIGKDGGHNLSGAWSISPPARQYSEVTLGTVGSGGGGPIVRIDRNNPGQTGWLLFLWVENPSFSGIYKVNPDGSFTAVRTFTPTVILAGDKWRLTANGNTLEVFRNGVSQFTFTTDGSYPTGDVGMEALTPAFTFMAWEGGDLNGPAQPPTIASFTPASGPVGTNVTITGTNFTGATAVTFNGANASFSATSATTIQATVPAGATTGSISVTAPGGTATSAGPFTVVNGPTITSFAPASGPVGASVTINGTNFTGATAVAFNGVRASFTVSSDIAIQTAVPAGATTGPLSVTAPGGTAQSSGAFTVPAPPTIASFAPVNGAVGTSVTINGSNLTGATSVTFNGLSASFTVQSDAVIQAVVPAGGTTGPVTVTTPAGSATSTSNFTVTATLSVANGGNGQGTVSSTSDRPPIGTSYEVGTVVTLTATPASGSDFTGWTGCDTVSGATCTVTMNASRSVIATFTLQTFPLTVSKASPMGIGNGTVTSTSSPASPTQINCGSNCSVRFNYGTVVTLTASPALLSIFNGWTGCDTASGTTCTVTIGAARSVTANFLP
jgi:Divergent InlB B-repeat domain